MSTKTVRYPWVDHLRGFITLLVVAHHSSLAYTTFANFNKYAYITSTHPIVDVKRWVGLDIFEDFNDIFFMSLMFLISGIFVLNGLRKGRKVFIHQRFYRLFIPFMIGVTVLMLLAYYPAYLMAYGKHDPLAYIIDFFTVESWPVGPPWFIWVLFFFNLLFAAFYPFLKKGISRTEAWVADQKRSPVKIVLALYLVTWILYVPITLWLGPSAWTGIGPFDFQVNRILLYFGYFMIGVILGSSDMDSGLFASGSAFSRRGLLWLSVCVVLYGFLKASESPLKLFIEQQKITALTGRTIYYSVWALSCTISCIAFMALFKDVFHRTNTWWQSLSANAYGIYLIHYIFVLWCQYLLLGYPLPAFSKFAITFIISVILSWFTASALRSIKNIL